MHGTLSPPSPPQESRVDSTTSGPQDGTPPSNNGKLANEMLCLSKPAGPEEEHMLPTVWLLFRED